MTTRRDFIRRGALWLTAAAIVEPVARKLWAFPTNPLGRQALTLHTNDTLHLSITRDSVWYGERSVYGGGVAIYSGDGNRPIATGKVVGSRNGILTIEWHPH